MDDPVSRTIVVTSPPRPQRLGWRDVALAVQSVTIVALVFVVVHLSQQIDERNVQASIERRQLTQQVSALTGQIEAARKENQRLIAILLANNIDPTPAVAPSKSTPTTPKTAPTSPVRPSPAARATTAPSPSPRPAPRPSSPPRPAPRPSPTPTRCAVANPLPLGPVCIVG